MRDTHGGPSNFRYGLDNWIWAMQGYNDSQPVLTDGEQVTRFRQGFFRFKVEGDGDKPRSPSSSSSARRTTTPGASASARKGSSSARRPTATPAIYMPIPNRYYEAVRGWSSAACWTASPTRNRFYPITDKVRQVDQHGGFTAAAGHALYTARTYPQRVLEPHRLRHRADRPPGRDVRPAAATAPTSARRNSVEPAGQRRRMDRADHGRGRPRRQRLGHRLVQLHRPAQPHARRLQDRQGQRLRDRAARQEARPHLSRSSTTGRRQACRADSTLAERRRREQLVAALKNDNMFWRLHAQRLLVERGKHDVVPALIELARRPERRCDRPERRRDPRPVDAARPGRARRLERRGRRRPPSRRSSIRRPACAATPCRCCRATGDRSAAIARQRRCSPIADAAGPPGGAAGAGRSCPSRASRGSVAAIAALADRTSRATASLLDAVDRRRGRPRRSCS